MRPLRALSLLLSFALTIAAADLTRNGFRIVRLTDKDEAMIAPACAKMESFSGDTASSHMRSCYPGSWARWLKSQQSAVIPAAQHKAFDACNMEGPARIYIVFPDGAKFLIWHVWEKGGDDRAFQLVNPATQELDVIWLHGPAPQYFGKRADVLKQGKVGDWLNELQNTVTF